MPELSTQITKAAEKDFLALPASARRQIANSLLRPTPLDVDSIGGTSDLFRIRVGDWRLPAKLLKGGLVPLRILPKPATERFFADYRRSERGAGACVPIEDSAIASFARGEAPLGLFEEFEQRADAKFSGVLSEIKSLGDHLGNLRELVELVEQCETEHSREVQRVGETLRDEFRSFIRNECTSLLQLVEERFCELETRRSKSVLQRLAAVFQAIIPVQAG